MSEEVIKLDNNHTMNMYYCHSTLTALKISRQSNSIVAITIFLSGSITYGLMAFPYLQNSLLRKYFKFMHLEGSQPI